MQPINNTRTLVHARTHKVLANRNPPKKLGGDRYLAHSTVPPPVPPILPQSRSTTQPEHSSNSWHFTKPLFSPTPRHTFCSLNSPPALLYTYKLPLNSPSPPERELCKTEAAGDMTNGRRTRSGTCLTNNYGPLSLENDNETVYASKT